MFHPTQPGDLIDERDRLRCFAGVEGLCDWTLDHLLAELDDPSPARRGLALASLMACARPDDVFELAGLERIRADWCHAQVHLVACPGRRRLWDTIFQCALTLAEPRWVH